MLYTNLKHLESITDYNKSISENRNVMIICGRMGPNGKVVKATSSIQTKNQVTAILNKEFSVAGTV